MRYYIDGEIVVILDDDKNEVNRIVVTPGDANLTAYLEAAAGPNEFTQVDPPAEEQP